MINLNLTKAKGKSILKLKGKLTVENAVEIKDVLLKATQANVHLELKLEDIADVDLTFLQLLSSVHKHLSERKGEITLSGAVPEALKQTVQEYGYCRESEDICFLLSTKSN